MKLTIPAMVLALAMAAAVAAAQPPGPGDRLPELVLPAPSPAQAAYLGVSPGQPLHPARVEADLLIIQVFSMYCPHCQRHAPTVNRLYQLLQTGGPNVPRVKIIGIGAGNSAFEVDYFRKTYAIAFPLFADPDFAAHDKLGKVRTPYFFAVVPEGGRARIVAVHAGGFDAPQAFLKDMVTAWKSDRTKAPTQ